MEPGDYYNLTRLFQFRDVLEGLNPRSGPKAVIINPSPEHPPARVGILCGAFNPPTLAHVELARRAKEGFNLDRILFTMSRFTIDKEKIEGLALEDRMLLLSSIAQVLGCASVAAVNRGLYFEQARAFRTLLGNRIRLFFVVGMDKVLQIFDPRYYDDRDKAMKGLFTEAQLIAANRGSLGAKELKELLAKKENQVYEDRIYSLTLPAGLREITSTELRNKIVKGESVKDRLPDVVDKFITATGAYRSDYDNRFRLIDRLYGIKDWAEKECNLEILIRIAAEETERGKRLRGMLGSGKLSSAELKDFVLNLKKV